MVPAWAGLVGGFVVVWDVLELGGLWLVFEGCLDGGASSGDCVGSVGVVADAAVVVAVFVAAEWAVGDGLGAGGEFGVALGLEGGELCSAAFLVGADGVDVLFAEPAVEDDALGFAVAAFVEGAAWHVGVAEAGRWGVGGGLVARVRLLLNVTICGGWGGNRNRTRN